ncbi:hypothetical protein FBEOM_7818 [Fusarium beomiforme]|uniref:Uncharacterized protein n=1 Tax=Fusarium beomiforme TaxID=44412 RepID=A0A9P5AH02_9HYPO|nr:hypothetical protein FBEOM_7818 [Fusarium beomiforme]
MTASLGANPGEIFSRGSSLGSCGYIEDKRDFDKLGSVIPDSQAASNTLLNQFHIRRFTIPREEVSTSSISEGFCFAEKKPPRPGQFSQRPKPEQPQAVDTSQFFPRTTNIPAERSPLSLPHAPIIRILRPAAPLDLPELGLTASEPHSEISPPLHQEERTGPSKKSAGHSEDPLQENPPTQADSSGASVIYIDSSDLSHQKTSGASPMSEPPPTENASISSTSQFGKGVAKDQVSRQVGGTKDISPSQIRDRGLQLDKLKLKLPHIAHVGRSPYHAPPSSVCGDLETPVPQTPKTTKSRGHGPRSHWPALSRASNISKKRSAKRKPRPQPTFELDRKKIAMQNVADYWNECIQIAEAERHEAFQEIALLADKLHCAKKALDKSAQAILERDSTIQDSLSRCNRLQEKGALAEEKTRRLHSEVESLRSDLAKSREHTTAIENKNRKNRTKLNEAIKEQQDLFLRARNLYDETSDELRKERGRRENDAKAVELALEASQKKREELRSCIEKYQAKLELMNNHLESCSEVQLTKEEAKSMVDRLESNILSRLMSEVQKIASTQTQIKQSAACLQDSLRSNFAQLHNNIADQQNIRSKDQQWLQETRHALAGHLDDISARTLATQRICNETRNNLAKPASDHLTWQRDIQTHFDNEVAEKLRDRESKIGELEETLRNISQEWSEKLDVMTAIMRKNDEQAKEYFQTTMYEIKITLEKKLGEEKAASEKDISKSEALHARVESHLQQVKMQLEGLSSSGSESQLLRETLAEERKETCDLQKQLAALEGFSSMNGEISKRQHQDIKAINALKSQLEVMSNQVPRVESLNTTFNKMVDLNQVMQSTALYLSKERHWVNEQLSVKSQSVGSHKQQQTEIGTQSAYFGEQRSEEFVAWVQAQSSGTKGSASLSDLATLDLHSQGGRYRRKVVVTSPVLEASSPALAPTVTQEQARRREGSHPRSILRLSNASSQETGSVRAPANHSQYNRPVMAKAGSSTGCSNPKMMEQIRSGLIQPKPARPKWDFPTMKDFAKGTLPDSKDDAILDKKHSISHDEEDAVSPAKRVKSEDTLGDSQTEKTDRPLLLGTRHIVRKTYSKKESN